MTENTFSNIEQTILDILLLHRDIHRRTIKAQMMEMSKITRQKFENDLFEESLVNLEKKGYIKRSKTETDTFI
ncbi:MAG: hypothetical protein ACFFAJ_18480, partial [Candidatus Hodarchaeota archaeon]